MQDVVRDLLNNHKVSAEVIEKDGLELYRFSVNNYNLLGMDTILFKRNKDTGYYEPFVYDYRRDDDGVEYGTVIEEGDAIFDWIRCVRFLFRQKDKRTKKWKDGTLYILQWIITINVLLDILKNTGNIEQLMGTRQFGKTKSFTGLDGFIGTFLPRYCNIENDRFWIIISSPLETTCRELMAKVKSETKKCIELYNILYPNERLITGIEAKQYAPDFKTYDDNIDKLEIGMLLEDKLYPYSVYYGITAGTMRDGISANYIHADEPQEIDAESFSTIENFGASSNPVIMLTGITSIETNNVQYKYHTLNIEKKKEFIVPFPMAYNTVKITHKNRAEAMLNFFDKKVEIYGMNHTEVATHFMQRWDAIQGKFMTEDLMERNKLLGSDLRLHKVEKTLYRVAGVDFASIEDYCTMVVVDAFFDDENGYSFETVGVHTLNADKLPLSDIEIADKLVDYINTYEIDMIMCDNTANQQNYTEKLYKAIKNSNFNTFLVTLNFSQKKVQMMSYLENLFLKTKILLPKKEYNKTNMSCGILFNELLTLKKEKKSYKQNIQYYASKPDTDDHVSALALACYCLKHTEDLIRSNTEIKFLGYRYSARMSKFKKGLEKPIYNQNKVNFTEKSVYAMKSIYT